MNTTFNSIRSLSHLVITLSLAATIIPTTAAEAPPVKVFILAGQSNMVGHGKVEYGRNPDHDPQKKGSKVEIPGGIGGLRYMLTNPKTRDQYKHLADADGKWVVRDDVWVYSTTDKTEKGLLTTGFGKGSWFGPELGFGHVMGNHIHSPVLIIKTSWGGHSLGINFRPPSSGQPQYAKSNHKPEDVGASYREMMKIVKDVTGNLDSHFPALKGRKVEFAGLGWHQGFNDSLSKEMTAEYEKNMVNFISDVRKELGVKDLPFVIATTGMNTKSPLNDIQMAVGDAKKHPELAGTVTSVDTRGFKRTKEQAPSGFGYHWNHSGESHFLVGDAMGKAMLKLLTK